MRTRTQHEKKAADLVKNLIESRVSFTCTFEGPICHIQSNDNPDEAEECFAAAGFTEAAASGEVVQVDEQQPMSLLVDSL
jgi:hypothetical protein